MDKEAVNRPLIKNAGASNVWQEKRLLVKLIKVF
jgi:hypothetical protein